MLTSIIGVKIDQSQAFDEQGIRIPVTMIKVETPYITQLKTKEADGYVGVQIGISTKKNTNNPETGHLKKSGTKNTPLFLREIKGETDKKVGDTITLKEIFKEGDNIKVSGIGKGKGFAGVVKRHHFHGGPKTHGQSDRLRAPGSIGSTTTPGRVYKGKRMAGRMGGEQSTIMNLKIMKIDEENQIITVKGLIPGPKKGLVKIEKI